MSTDNPTAPRGDDPTANEMTLSLRVDQRAKREAKSRAGSSEAAAAEPLPCSDAARSFGHFTEESQREDSRFGHLLVVCGDWLTHDEGDGRWSANALPELIRDALISAAEAVSGRCVVVCTGGPGLSHAMVSRLVGAVELDACGPGRRVEVLLKERSGEWGNAVPAPALALAPAPSPSPSPNSSPSTVSTHPNYDPDQATCGSPRSCASAWPAASARPCASSG